MSESIVTEEKKVVHNAYIDRKLAEVKAINMGDFTLLENKPLNPIGKRGLLVAMWTTHYNETTVGKGSLTTEFFIGPSMDAIATALLMGKVGRASRIGYVVEALGRVGASGRTEMYRFLKRTMPHILDSHPEIQDAIDNPDDEKKADKVYGIDLISSLRPGDSVELLHYLHSDDVFSDQENEGITGFAAIDVPVAERYQGRLTHLCIVL